MQQSLTLAETLKRESHRICTLILNSDVEWIDIEIEINRLRELCETRAPEKLELFEAIYVGRFERLWDQWHDDRPSEPFQRDGEWGAGAAF
jgi:hypothetical protein